MNELMGETYYGHPDSSARATFAEDVDRLRAQVSQEAADDLLAAIGALEVAQEELRVADEEIAAQREQIDWLLQQHEADGLWRQRLSTALPVALLRTRHDGAVVEVNTAAAMLLNVAPGELTGKPLASFVAPDDRPALRSALRQLTVTAGEQTLLLRLAPRGGGVVAATAVATAVPRPDAAPWVQWVLMTEAHAPLLAPKEPSLHDIATARALAAMCQLPLTAEDRQTLLQRLAVLAQEAVPRAAGVSVTVGAPEDPEQLSSDRQLAQRLDAAQMQAVEGPCVEAFHSREIVVTHDVASDPRWPRLARLAQGLGVSGVLAVPLTAADQCLGVLNVYASFPDKLDEQDERISELVGRSVSAVLHTAADRDDLARLAANLNAALTSRAVIDQAKGIVMARLGCSADEAFRRLSVMSQRSNIKLREVARMLVEGIAGADPVSTTDQALSPPAGP